MEDITKEYTNDEVMVVWEPAVCRHSAIFGQRYLTHGDAPGQSRKIR